MNRDWWWAAWLPDDGLVGNPAAAWWIVAAAVSGVMCLFVVLIRRRAQRRFATEDRLADFFDSSSFFARHRVVGGVVSAAVLSMALVLLGLSMMDIRWGKTEQEVPQKGIEVLFLLDVSRSMLAEDARPNRLERAKQMIRDMVERMAGDRVGLIVFAGETRQVIPLTSHYEDFSRQLEDVSPNSVRRGGSRLGDAIESGGRAFLSKTNSHRVIVVLTDGEDQESEPVKMAKRLHDDEKIRIFTVGLGDMDSGSRIPDVDRERPRHETGRYVKYQGEPVWSKMNGAILRQIATETDGVYIPAGTKQVDMATIYDRYIAGMQATEFETAKVDTYAARYQWFALPAFVLLLIDYVVRLVARRTPRGIGRSASVAGMLLVFCLNATPTHGQTIDPAADLETDPTESTLEPTSVYNRGVKLYREGDFSAAVDAFAQAVGAGSDEVAASARYNLGTSCYAAAIEILATIQAPPTQGATDPNDTTDANDVNSVSATEQAKQILQQGIGALRSALRMRPEWEDARANLEKSVQLLAVIQQSEQQQQEKSGQQENPEQSQSQESSDSQDQDSGDEDSQQQSSSQDNSGKQQSEQSNSDSEDAESETSDQQDSSDEQNEGSNAEKGQESQNSEGDPQPEEGPQQQPSGSDEQNDANSPSDSQASAPPSNEQDSNEQMSGHTGDSDEQSDPAETGEQGEAEQETTPQDVSGSLSGDNQDESSQAAGPNAVRAGEGKPDDRPMTAEEAMKMLQAIRDRDLIRRFRLQQLQQQRQIPVEKDW